jgi:hypothetical protein
MSRKAVPAESVSNLKQISACQFDLYWQSRHGVGRRELLHALAGKAAAEGWRGDFFAEWQAHDIELIGDLWHDVRIGTASEELGGLHRFTRARCTLHLTWVSYITASAGMLWAAAASLSGNPYALGITAALLLGVMSAVWISRRRVKHAVAGLLARAGVACELDPYGVVDRLLVEKTKSSLVESEDLPALVSE